MSVLGLLLQTTTTTVPEKAWYATEPWSWVFSSIVTLFLGAGLLFLVNRLVGWLRPFKVQLASYWWTCDDGKLVGDDDPTGAAPSYHTLVMLQIKGKRLQGKRTLTEVKLLERPKRWQPWTWWRWRRRASSLDLVGPWMDGVRSPGVVLGDDDTGAEECEVTQGGATGRWELSDRWRVVPMNGPKPGKERKLKPVKLIEQGS